MKMRTTILIAVLNLTFALSVQSQDLHLSQFFETPLLRNPALAGIFTGDVRVQTVYRDQWNSVTSGYRTGSLSGEYKVSVGKGDDYVTWGMQLFYDKAGTVSYTQTKILPALNYHKSLSSEKNTYLSLGFMGGWVQRSIDRSKVTTNSQWDGSGYNASLDINESLTNYNLKYGDASVGMSFNSGIG